MLVLLVVVGLALLGVPLLGGRLRRLASIRFQGMWLLGVSLAMQVSLGTVLLGPPTGWRVWLHIASYGFAVAFLFANRRTPGFWLIGIGGMLNLIAIAANGGVMPASAHALSVAGIHDVAGVFANSAAVAHPHLAFLGDVFAMPKSWPFANVLSVGDISIAVGGVVTVFGVAGVQPFDRSSRAQPATDTGPGLDPESEPVPLEEPVG